MGKNIVFCADGTWDDPHPTGAGQSVTNVYKIYQSLLQTPSQTVHYDDGVGTSGVELQKLIGGALGLGLFQKIKDGCLAVGTDYEDGDRICLIGFSRGAYQVRSLAGMIAACGLPQVKMTPAIVDEMFACYRSSTRARSFRRRLAELKRKYGNRPVSIAFVGVWDTVGALGIPCDLFQGLNDTIYGFLNTSLHPSIETACQALSIDERRGVFSPTLWGKPQRPGQKITQIWAPGGHSDIGGGYTQGGLADIMLGWMMDQAMQSGLLFDPAAVKKYLPPDPNNVTAPIHNPVWIFPSVRKIPPHSAISDAVVLRAQALPSYRPANVPGLPGSPPGFVVDPIVGGLPPAPPAPSAPPSRPDLPPSAPSAPAP